MSINEKTFSLYLNASKLFSFVIENLSELFYFIVSMYASLTVVAAAKLLSRSGSTVGISNAINVVASKIIMKAYVIVSNNADLMATIKERGKIYVTANNVIDVISATYARVNVNQIINMTSAFTIASVVLAQLYPLSRYDAELLSTLDVQTLADLDSVIL